MINSLFKCRPAGSHWVEPLYPRCPSGFSLCDWPVALFGLHSQHFQRSQIEDTLVLRRWTGQDPYCAKAQRWVSQRVQRPTETPDAILTRVLVPGVARDFSPTVRTLLGCPYSPLCAVACISSCAHVRNSKHGQPYHCLDTRKYCTHW